VKVILIPMIATVAPFYSNLFRVIFNEASQFMYIFAKLMKAVREQDETDGENLIDLPKETFGNYHKKRLSLIDHNKGKGEKLQKVLDIIERHKDMYEGFDRDIIDRLVQGRSRASIWLQTFNSFKQAESCVYAVTKNV